MSSSVFSGVQPRPVRARSLEATSLGGSPRATRLLARDDVDAGDPARGLDHLAHRRARRAAEVVDRMAPGLGLLQREDVRAPEVLDVDVVAHRGPVRRRVVRAEDRDALAFARGRLQHERDQVRLGMMVLAQLTARPGDVEVAQRDRGEAVGARLVGEHPIDRELRVPVRVDRPVRRVLGDQVDVRLAIRRRRRGEHDPLDPVRSHRVEQVERADDVAAVVALRELDGLGDQRQRREVHDAVDSRHGRVDRLGVEQVDLQELGTGGNGGAVAAVERVEHGDLVAALQQLLGDDRADVAGTAGDEESHGATRLARGDHFDLDPASSARASRRRSPWWAPGDRSARRPAPPRSPPRRPRLAGSS